MRANQWPLVYMLVSFLVSGAVPAALAYRGGPGTCTYPSAGWTDMGNGRFGTGGFVLAIQDDAGPVTHYVPGLTYNVVISNTESNYAGFLVQSVAGTPGNPNTNGVGQFEWGELGMFRNGPCAKPLSSVGHTDQRVATPRASDVLLWTAPPVGTGSVTFHLVGVKSRFEWWGRETLITLIVLEGTTAVNSATWSRVKSLFR